MKKRIHGFIEPKITEDNYVLGAFSLLPRVVLQKDLSFQDYLPDLEDQKKFNIETCNCTGFAINKCKQILAKRLFGETVNNSDRFLGILAGTYPPGNDPHTVCEAARKGGFIPEQALPFTDELNSVDDYYSFKGSSERYCRELGEDWVYYNSFQHEWVLTGKTTKKRRIELMREALQYSPLAVSVSAWHREGDVYVDNGQRNNHLTVIYGDSGKEWLCIDTYPPFLKKISYDHDIRYVKRFHIERRPLSKGVFTRLMENLYELLPFLK